MFDHLANTVPHQSWPKRFFEYCNFYCAAEWYTCSWGFQLLLRAVRVPFLWQPAMVTRTNIWRKKNATFYGGDDSLDFWSTFQRFSLLFDTFPTLSATLRLFSLQRVIVNILKSGANAKCQTLRAGRCTCPRTTCGALAVARSQTNLAHAQLGLILQVHKIFLNFISRLKFSAMLD